VLSKAARKAFECAHPPAELLPQWRQWGNSGRRKARSSASDQMADIGVSRIFGKFSCLCPIKEFYALVLNRFPLHTRLPHDKNFVLGHVGHHSLSFDLDINAKFTKNVNDVTHLCRDVIDNKHTCTSNHLF